MVEKAQGLVPPASRFIALRRGNLPRLQGDGAIRAGVAPYAVSSHHVLADRDYVNQALTKAL